MGLLAALVVMQARVETDTRQAREGVDIVLASGSPRRRELLGSLGLEFVVAPADIDESPRPQEAPEALAGRLAAEKAAVVAAENPEALVIAADTVVALDDRQLGKPRDRAENEDFLRLLSGQEHTVFTGHALALRGRSETRVVASRVRFRELSKHEIDWYAATGEGLDKAGGYAIQGFGAALVAEICGCYFNVVGLSVANVLEMARALGVELV